MKKHSILLVTILLALFSCTHVTFRNKGEIVTVNKDNAETITKEINDEGHDSVVAVTKTGSAGLASLKAFINDIVKNHTDTGFYEIPSDSQIYIAGEIGEDVRAELGKRGDSDNYDVIVAFYKKGVLTAVYTGEITEEKIEEKITGWKDSKTPAEEDKFAGFYILNANGDWILKGEKLKVVNNAFEAGKSVPTEVAEVTLAADAAGTEFKNGDKLVWSGKWTDKKNGSGTEYTTPKEGCWYAKYTKNAGYTVTFHANGGKGTMAQQIIPAGTPTNLNPNKFYEGDDMVSKTFAKWNTAAAGTGDSYTDKQQVTLTGNLELYAQWTDDLFYIQAEEDNVTIEILSHHQTGTPMTKCPEIALEYSTDGEIWNTLERTAEGTETLNDSTPPRYPTCYPFKSTYTLTTAGEKVYLREKNNTAQMFGANEESFTFLKISDNKKASLNGDISRLCKQDGDLSSTLNNDKAKFFFLCESSSSYGNTKGLTKIPRLPKKLPQRSFGSAFRGCENLESVVINSTEIGDSALSSAFYDCTSLEKAEIKATTLDSSALSSIFENCSFLNEVTVHFTEWPSNNACSQWLEGVSATGTFHCPAALADPGTRGSSTVPVGWTIVKDVE